MPWYGMRERRGCNFEKNAEGHVLGTRSLMPGRSQQAVWNSNAGFLLLGHRHSTGM